MMFQCNTTAIRLAISIACAVSVLCAPPAAEALEVEGEIQELYKNVFLVKAQERHEVVYVTDATELVNLEDYRKLRYFDRVKATGVRNPSGAVVAGTLEVAPEAAVENEMRMETEDLWALVSAGKGKYVLIDTRPEEEYQKGHLPGAVSMPTGAFDPSVLPKKKDYLIVFYGTGPWDSAMTSHLTAATESEYTAIRVFPEGILGWTRKYKPLEISVEGLKGRISAGERLVILDIRSERAVVKGHIAGAVSIPDEALTPNNVMRPWLPVPMVVYDRGGRSREAARAAVKILGWGYSGWGEAPVHVLDGGVKAWQKAGLGLVEGEAPASIEYEPEPESGVIGYDEFRRIWDSKRTRHAEGKSYDEDGYLLLNVKALSSFAFSGGIPIKLLADWEPDLPMDREIIVYCSFGFRARIAYHLLRNLGYRARYLSRNPLVRPDGTFSDKQD